MVKPKMKSKKTQKKGIDFKKIQRKIGRKLPPAKNATNTEITSKAIVLPEQSVASERAGFAVNKKGLTLKELLNQTTHHNAKVRKNALFGVKDILSKHPAELKLHKLFVVQKLSERIGDEDKSVRETLYDLFKNVILPGSGKVSQENHEPLVSSMMAQIFTAMNHLAPDVRLMAFKFWELVIRCYPSSFSLFAEKILQKYEVILRMNQFLEDKENLKRILAGLAYCLSLLPFTTIEECMITEEETPVHDILHAFEPEIARKPVGLTDIAKKSMDLLPILVARLLDFMPVVHTSQLDAKSFDCMKFILQSIDHVVKFYCCWVSESDQDPQKNSPSPKFDVTACYPSFPPMILKKLWDIFPLNLGHQFSGKVDERSIELNTVITQIFLQNYSSSALLEKFLEYIKSSLKIQSEKKSHEKHLLSLVPFIPKLAMEISGDQRSCLLQAFTAAFKNCEPESSMKLAYLSAIEKMLATGKSWIHLDADDSALLDSQIAWMKALPSLLFSLEHKKPVHSEAVLRLLLHMGKATRANSPFSQEFDNIQHDLNFQNFFGRQTNEGVCDSPFSRLAADIQELAICSLYYFSYMDSQILQSLISCCLCDNLEPSIVIRILEVIRSAFRDGHIHVADFTSFHVTLLSRVQPERSCPNDGKSNWKIFKLVTSIVCTCLSEIGEDHLVLEMLEKIILEQICSKIPVHNKCAFLRLLVTLGFKPTRLSDQSIVKISHVLPEYLIDIIHNGEEYNCGKTSVISAKRRQYYLIPAFHLFHRCSRLLNLVLIGMGTLVSHPRHLKIDRCTLVCVIASVIHEIYEDIQLRRILLSCSTEIEILSPKLLDILSSEGKTLSFAERHKIQSACDQVRAIANDGVARHP